MNRAPGSRARCAADPAGLETFGDGSVQVDLFGLVDAELARRAADADRRAEFDRRARHMPDGSPVQWTAPHDTTTARVGQTTPGWRCWLCGGIEMNAYVLDLVHGLHPADPACLDRTACTVQTRIHTATPADGDQP